ncbi:MAG: nucleotidyltransferase domain-containing protein [Sorangiineae bacterium PRO1]|nr:nucleotidyltransferase domain-containing protein [Sorangiineae bacterium PRO1]
MLFVADTEAELTRRLESVPEILFALLFGSRAAGTPRADSDWDVAVFLSPALSAAERFRLRARLSGELGDLGQVDVVVLNDAPPLLAHRALQGRLLTVADRTAYVRFFVATVSASEDERYFREIHDRARRERLEEGRFGRS